MVGAEGPLKPHRKDTTCIRSASMTSREKKPRAAGRMMGKDQCSTVNGQLSMINEGGITAAFTTSREGGICADPVESLRGKG